MAATTVSERREKKFGTARGDALDGSDARESDDTDDSALLCASDTAVELGSEVALSGTFELAASLAVEACDLADLAPSGFDECATLLAPPPAPPPVPFSPPFDPPVGLLFSLEWLL